MKIDTSNREVNPVRESGVITHVKMVDGTIQKLGEGLTVMAESVVHTHRSIVELYDYDPNE